ncbi:hypothetical protein KCU67_g5, partial [Aureobasidium melanogenum]
MPFRGLAKVTAPGQTSRSVRSIRQNSLKGNSREICGSRCIDPLPDRHTYEAPGVEIACSTEAGTEGSGHLNSACGCRIYTMTVEKVLIQGLHISTRVTEPDAVLTQFAVPVFRQNHQMHRRDFTIPCGQDVLVETDDAL